jgi:hypothetical protein
VGWLSGCFCEGEGGGCGSECGCWKDGGGRSCRWRERREASAKPIELRLTAEHSKGNRRRAQPHKAHMPQPHIFHQEFCGLARHTSFMRLFRHTSFRHTVARLASSSALSSKEVEVRVEQPQDPPSTTTNNSLDHHVEAVFKEYFATPPKKRHPVPASPYCSGIVWLPVLCRHG